MIQTLIQPGGTAVTQRQGHRGALLEAARLLLFPLVALFVVLPLQAHGSACGDDFPFHLSSWLDAARQMRGGVLYPHWTDLGAYNAGEPRFTFYPPISWMLGALLVLLLPSAPVTVVYIFLALTMAGWAMYALARQYAAPNVALLCAAFYAVNPYMVCNAVERSAFAELLSATWMPLLLLGLLRRRLSVVGLALPLALLWLTNVPSAITGVYTYGLLFALRIALLLREHRGTAVWPQVRRALGLGASGFLLGVALPAFYLLPAVAQKHYIQGASAFDGPLQIGSNFLFSHSGDALHQMIVRQVSWIAVSALSLSTATLAYVLLSRRPRSVGANDGDGTLHRPGAHRPGAWTGGAVPHDHDSVLPVGRTASLLIALCAVVGFGLTPLSAPFWRLPELNLLQFPWRLLTLLLPVVALGLVLALRQMEWGSQRLLLYVPGLVLPLALLAVHSYRRGSLVPHLDQYMAHLSAGGRGFHGTPEYAVAGASDTALLPRDPGFWTTATTDGRAPGTAADPPETPDRTKNSKDPNVAMGWGPPAAISQPAPRHLAVDLAQPAILVLHLRAYPEWQMLRNGVVEPLRLHRTDGLIALALPAGHSVVDVRWNRSWKRSWERYMGDALSLLAAVCLLGVSRLAYREVPMSRN